MYAKVTLLDRNGFQKVIEIDVKTRYIDYYQKQPKQLSFFLSTNNCQWTDGIPWPRIVKFFCLYKKGNEFLYKEVPNQ